MKNLILLVLSLFVCNALSFANPINIGEKLPELSIALYNSPSEQLSTKNLNGKILIIEFWATWCSPCITAMDHLQTLKDEFGEKVEVVAINIEGDEERLAKFINSRNYSIEFSMDEDENLRNLFPFMIIPHSILIDTEGNVVAITAPQNINGEVINKLLEKQVIDLPLKQENTSFDFAADYFNADPNTQSSFVIQPNIAGVPSFHKDTFEEAFQGRRLSFHNSPIDNLYQKAYQTTSKRLVYEIDEKQFEFIPENLYCVDIIVPKSEKADLYTIFQEKLAASFTPQARLEKREMDVVLITRIDTLALALEAAPTHERFRARGDSFKSEGATIADFAFYLENHGIINKPVIDESLAEGYYNIDFSFEPGNSASFHEAMRKMGLKVKKGKREIEVLVIY